MARTKSISDNALLKRARSALLKHGTKITSALLAEATGVSEGTLYKRFGTKNNLMIRAIANPDALDWDGLFDHVPEGTLVERLAYLLGGTFDRLDMQLPGFMMLKSHGIDPSDIFAQFEVPPPVMVLRRLTAFFEHEQAAGRINDTDPLTAARAVLATAHSHAFGRMFGIVPKDPASRGHMIDEAARVLAFGIAAQEPS